MAGQLKTGWWVFGWTRPGGTGVNQTPAAATLMATKLPGGGGVAQVIARAVRGRIADQVALIHEAAAPAVVSVGVRVAVGSARSCRVALCQVSPGARAGIGRSPVSGPISRRVSGMGALISRGRWR